MTLINDKKYQQDFISTWCRNRIMLALIRSNVSPIFLSKLIFNDKLDINDIANVFDSQSIIKLNDYLRRYELVSVSRYHLRQYLSEFIEYIFRIPPERANIIASYLNIDLPIIFDCNKLCEIDYVLSKNSGSQAIPDIIYENNSDQLNVYSKFINTNSYCV